MLQHFALRTVRSKLVAGALGVALLPVIALGVLGYGMSSSAQTDATADALRSHARHLIDKIDRNLFERYGDVQAFAFHPDAQGEPARVSDVANFYTRCYGIYDLMLIVDLDGTVVAANTTSFDGKPIATASLLGRSVRGEPWFEDIVSGKLGAGRTFVSDLVEDPWVKTACGGRGLALNFSAPILDAEGKVVRVWSNRASFDRIVGAMFADTAKDLSALGIDDAALRLLDLRGTVLFDADPAATLTTNLVDSGFEAARRAIAGELGSCVDEHPSDGKTVVTGFAHSSGALGFAGFDWSVLVSRDVDHAFAALATLRLVTVGAALLATLFVFVVGSWGAGRIARPIVQTARLADALAAGDLTQQCADGSDDEIGRMSASVNRAILGIKTAFGADRVQWQDIAQQKQIAAEASARERAQNDELRQKVDSLLAVVSAAASGDLTHSVTVSGQDAIGRMGDGLGHFVDEMRSSLGRIQTTAQTLTRSAASMSNVSEQVGSSAEETASQANVVSAAAEEVSKSVQTVALATDQITSSFSEIQQGTSKAASVADSGVRAAENANQKVAKLAASSAEIDKVSKVITSIAQQTNLLALNATIEAARAGEAGKGFAVVANEVKELAKETTKATGEIGRMIATIQSDSQGAIESIQEISTIINQINMIQQTIAAAVTEQSASTTEIGRNVQEAARGVAEIAQNIMGVAQAAQGTSVGASDTQKASVELKRVAHGLDSLVAKFKLERPERSMGPIPLVSRRREHDDDVHEPAAPDSDTRRMLNEMSDHAPAQTRRTSPTSHA
ncbi:MAG: methyl-accepting chemotaxis protein [Planctomycetes bacterium]|nr:methyl-accepting chemotaxis protein [Planctomycetota bacterium]MCC7171506.1 methyl-accepting chemotaxis protein [Planctomycetota bacterium]